MENSFKVLESRTCMRHIKRHYQTVQKVDDSFIHQFRSCCEVSSIDFSASSVNAKEMYHLRNYEEGFEVKTTLGTNGLHTIFRHDNPLAINVFEEILNEWSKELLSKKI